MMRYELDARQKHRADALHKYDVEIIKRHLPTSRCQGAGLLSFEVCETPVCFAKRTSRDLVRFRATEGMGLGVQDEVVETDEILVAEE